MTIQRPVALFLTALFIPFVGVAQQAQILDMLLFGDPDSEAAHQTFTTRSEQFQGAFGETVRRLLPSDPVSWEGGRITFALKVHPAEPNYFTIKFWGSETNPNRLVLYCEGKQIGYNHLGDYGILCTGSAEPAYNGRFFYHTGLLPEALTKGKTELLLQIRSRGPIDVQGQSFEGYQKNMEEPARSMYRVYTHTGGCFTPPADERQGAAPAAIPLRQTPGPEILDKLKIRVNGALTRLLSTPRALEQQEMGFLAKAWHTRWTVAWQNPAVVEQVARSIDTFYRRQTADPDLVAFDPQQYNPGWFGFGTIGLAIDLLQEQWQQRLDQVIDDGQGHSIVRRQAWAGLMLGSREYLRAHRRQNSPESMIVDWNLYLSNKALRVLAPDKALPEADVRRYLYESVGLQPWLGSDTGQGPAKPMGEQYRQLTRQGLTREPGYTGYDGEVLDKATQIYLATCTGTDPRSGDEKIRDQLIKMARARAVFRYPAQDAYNYRAMRIETVIGWRDGEYPGDVTYSEWQGPDASPFLSAAATLDHKSLGIAQQMLADNQFFESVREKMDRGDHLRAIQSLLPVPDQYDVVRTQPPGPHRLPMTPGQPDFVWSDMENGVVALKNGDDILYASLYWRARHAVNFLARVHYITPKIDRLATVRQGIQFEPAGEKYTRPDDIDSGFGNGGHPYPGNLHSVHAGEQLPVAKNPAGGRYAAGVENSFTGRGDCYTMRYGKYLICMNTTPGKTFKCPIPGDMKQVKSLVSGAVWKGEKSLKIQPGQTEVLYQLD